MRQTYLCPEDDRENFCGNEAQRPQSILYSSAPSSEKQEVERSRGPKEQHHNEQPSGRLEDLMKTTAFNYRTDRLR